jgi:hypothetical protein
MLEERMRSRGEVEEGIGRSIARDGEEGAGKREEEKQRWSGGTTARTWVVV